jgi:hypothetical protein
MLEAQLFGMQKLPAQFSNLSSQLWVTHRIVSTTSIDLVTDHGMV